MYSPKIDPALVARLHTMAKVLGMPMTSLVNQLLSDGLDRLEAVWREDRDQLSQVAEPKRGYEGLKNPQN